MKTSITTFTLMLSALLFSACQQDPELPTDISTVEDKNQIGCKEPRPQICTQEYRPVCAKLDTGVRCVKTPCPESSEYKTYSTGCTACGDKRVYSYRNGAC